MGTFIKTLRDPRVAFVGVTLFAAFVIGGCSGGNPAPTAIASPCPGSSAASVTGTLAFSAGYQMTPSVAGYCASLYFPAQSVPAGVTAPYVWSVNQPAATPVPLPACTTPPIGLMKPLVYLSFVPSSNVATNPSPSETFYLPASLSTVGQTFYLEFDDVTRPANPCPQGPGGMGNRSVTFNGAGQLSLTGGHTYVGEVLEYQPTAAPTM